MPETAEAGSIVLVEPPRAMSKCGQVFRNDNGQFDYFCTVCPMQTQRADQFEVHVSMHFEVEFVSTIKEGDHDESQTRPVESEQPQHIDVKLENAKPPNKSSNDSIRTCPFCDKMFLRVKSFLRHLRGVHQYTPAAKSIDPTVRMQCDLCDASFVGPYARGLITHHLREHRRRRWPQLCTVCKKWCSSQRVLNDHMLTHTNERPYRCEICDVGFNAKSTLTNHRFTHSNVIGFVCAECGLGFVAQYQLNKHISRKHRITTYTCELCEPQRQFVGYSLFAYHKESVHFSNGKAFECDVCLKRFKIKKKLFEHRKVHSGERSYLCRYCGKGFSQSQGKRAHERRTHEGSMPPERTRRQRKLKCNIDDM